MFGATVSKSEEEMKEKIIHYTRIIELEGNRYSNLCALTYTNKHANRTIIKTNTREVSISRRTDKWKKQFDDEKFSICCWKFCSSMTNGRHQITPEAKHETVLQILVKSLFRFIPITFYGCEVTNLLRFALLLILRMMLQISLLNFSNLIDIGYDEKGKASVFDKVSRIQRLKMAKKLFHLCKFYPSLPFIETFKTLLCSMLEAVKKDADDVQETSTWMKCGEKLSNSIISVTENAV
ncbi:CLUMA_CG000787, isoform A [Clunio marinus]|uniref:CLUMA_CG000787, isoform A n=1 Tax=Clunio marinus TaxID=568069 RepID=A0A1J1HKI4_9DIPT|nr:CLUMA_CG000787, isoform A [Clunio marinus]